MSKLIHRRSFVKGISGVAVAPYLAACGPAQEDPVMSPADAPIGPFGAESTAEEVTEGIDLSGTTAVVTGANSGLGFETMRVLALRGAHVIGTGRTLEKAEAACDSISGNATPAVLELTDFDSIAA
jgi:NADPH:quinone reductase-like Zn-dependent oxidoreductase